MGPPDSLEALEELLSTQLTPAQPNMSQASDGTALIAQSNASAGAIVTPVNSDKLESTTASSNGSAGTPTPAAGNRMSFLPELSASTQMILERLRAGSGVTGSSAVVAPGYEDVRRSVLENMKTTLSMDQSPVAPPTGGRIMSVPRKASTSTKTKEGGGPTRRVGRKRKRGKQEDDSTEERGSGEDDSESEESVAKGPLMTKSGRQVLKPATFNPTATGTPSRKRGPAKRSQESALCKRCGRGYSPQTNQIVFCDGCNLGWHQLCHDPAIMADVVKDESKEWFCSDCKAKREKARARTAESRRGGLQDRGLDEKRAYLAALPHQDLVSILLQATILHPDLPLVAKSPQELLKMVGKRSGSQSQGASPSTNQSNRPATPKATASAVFKGFGSNGTPTKISTPQQAHTIVDTEFSRESTPASPPYPKPGSGLMANLPPDNEDLEWLVDDGEFTAFSHILYDKNGTGQKIEENGVMIGSNAA